jgi:signal transduction histidine kinase
MKTRLRQIVRTAWFDYVASILLSAAVVLFISRLPRGAASEPVTCIVEFVAIAFCAWNLGIGPAVVSTGIFVLSELWPAALSLKFPVPDRTHWSVALAILFAAAVIIAMAELRRLQNVKLREGQSELEVKVKERTAALDTANRSLRDLSARLLQLQDEERRRIARELHDSVGQLLAALSMNVSTVRGEIERLTKAATVLTDSDALIQEMSKEVRTISHLLHPPLLDEAGFASAVRWYIDGFAQRSGIKIELDCPDNFGRLPREVETAMFRVVQECLTNIHRHSGSQRANIRCRQFETQVLVEVSDHGAGIPPEKLAIMATNGTPGVGIRGMRERIRQLGGELEITSGYKGTVVAARLPVPEESVQGHSDSNASKAVA